MELLDAFAMLGVMVGVICIPLLVGLVIFFLAERP